MSGWVAIPKAASACARSREARSAVLDLYERADDSGYPVTPWVERDLAIDWGMDRREVVRLLESLAAAGCLILQRAEPGSRRSSTLQVVPAVRLHQTGSQNWSQNVEPTTPAIADAAPDPAPDPAPARAEVFARAKTRQDKTIRPDDQTDVDPAPPVTPLEDAPTEPDRYDEAALYFGEIVHRAIGRRPSKGPERRSKLGQKLLREVKRDADGVLDAMRYVAEGRGDKAAYLRSYDGLTVETVTRHVEEYAELWRAEQEPGWRPRPPPTRDKPRRPNQPPSPAPYVEADEPPPF